MTPAGDTEILHASCVAVDGRALLITGPSGAGKSALALQLMALGARLVSDDWTAVQVVPGGLVARCPAPAIRGLIEARGLGLLRADPLDMAQVALVADLSQDEDQRLPPHRAITILGCSLPLVLRVQNDHFTAALMLYLRGGRQS
ncbi:MAG: HPr kinase/phosphatase C-terminal domain-containing protein [Paracoccaceae bacterium]|nr:HPr kinase/phosphatase C-terminal domain-containing protein [Rhodobacter sp.]